MQREYVVLGVVAVLLATAGCVDTFDDETGPIEIGSEEGPQGQTFVYVASPSSQLPADTTITVENDLDGVEDAEGTLDRPVNEGTRVYLGGPIGSASVTEFRHGMPPSSSVVPNGVDVTLTVTVDDGDRVARETLPFEG